MTSPIIPKPVSVGKSVKVRCSTIKATSALYRVLIWFRPISHPKNSISVRLSDDLGDKPPSSALRSSIAVSVLALGGFLPQALDHLPIFTYRKLPHQYKQSHQMSIITNYNLFSDFVPVYHHSHWRFPHWFVDRVCFLYLSYLTFLMVPTYDLGAV